MRPRLGAAAAVVIAALLASASAGADTADPARPASPAAEDWRSTGPEVVPARGRPNLAEVACSFVEHACVHLGAAVSPRTGLATLRAAEHALRAYRALGFPAPRARFDVYVDASFERPSTVTDLDPTSDGWDRASAFTMLPASAVGGQSGAFAVAEGVAEAIVLGLDAGVERGVLAMTATYLAALVTDCPALSLDAVDDFQAHPERSFVAHEPGPADGAMLFPWFLDDTVGVGGPGRAAVGLVALATQRTPVGSWEYKNEPDVFDVLRATMRDRSSTLDNLLLDFAVARGFVGSRSDGKHLTDVERFGAFGRVRFEWSVPVASLPRRLAPLVPIAPTGMTYLWLDLSAGAPARGEITFVADWEPPALFRWSLVKVDKEGAQAARVDVAGVFGDTHVERTLVGLDGLAGVMVVGVNIGSVDRSHPFDPDEQPLMPHAYAVTLLE